MMSSRVGIDFSKSTFTSYGTTYGHISQFLKEHYKLDDIILIEIQYSFITDLEHFLKVTRKCNHNSSQKYIRNFRKIINNAIKNNWLDKDPFKSYRAKLKDTKRVFLTPPDAIFAASDFLAYGAMQVAIKNGFTTGFGYRWFSNEEFSTQITPSY